MEVYQTENQQVEAIKQFFIKYRSLFLITILLVLVIIVGGKFWQSHKDKLALQASDLYQELLLAEYKKDTSALEATGQRLLQGFKGTPYPQMAALLLAKHAVNSGDIEKAEQHLRWIIAQSDAKHITFAIATERLARLLLERGDIDGGLKLLTASKPAAPYQSLYEETIGDLYIAKGDREQAKIAYLKAMEKQIAGTPSPLLQMKLIDLGVGEDNA